MSASEVKRIKMDLIEWIKHLDNERMISILKGIKDSGNENNEWNSLPDEQKRIISAGLNDVEKGDLISSANFWEKIKSAS